MNRTFNFSSSNEGDQNYLTKNTCLILTFVNLDKSKLFKEQYPVAWKILNVSSGEDQNFAGINYAGTLGVLKPTTDVNDCISGGINEKITLGKQTSLTLDSGNIEAYRWSVPTPINPAKPDEGVATARNDVPHDVDICVGTYGVKKGKPHFQPVLYHKGVGNGSEVSVELTPLMRVYAADDYKEAKIMRTQVSSFLGEWNLAKLDPNNAAEFTFFKASKTGRITLVSDQDAVPGVLTEKPK